MRRTIIGIPLLVVLLALSWREAHAATDNVVRYVLIVANNRSLTPTVANLHYADDDGVMYAEVLGPFAEHVVLLTDLDGDTQRRYPQLAAGLLSPTRANLDHELTKLFAAITKQRERSSQQVDLLFIYIGHGSVDAESKGYVHLRDGKFTRADLFHDVISASPAHYTHLLIDSCNAFSLVAGRGDDAETVAFQQFMAGHDLDDYPTVGLLAATSRDRESHEWSKLEAGVFSHQVRSGMLGAADVNGDGLIEYSELAGFVDAANSELQRFGKAVSTLALPPARHRRIPLLNLRAGQATRHLVLGTDLAGKFFIESSEGHRWADFNKASGDPTVLALPAGRAFYLRDGEREQEIVAGARTVRLREPPARPYAIQPRGAIDQAFETALFAVPYTSSYYRGYVSGRNQLVPVEEIGERFLAEPNTQRAAWTLGAGWVTGNNVLKSEQLEHGLYFTALRYFHDNLSLSGSVEVGYSHLEDNPADTGVRFALLPGIAGNLPVHRGVDASVSIEVGYAALMLAGDKPSSDWSVGVGRVTAGVAVRVVRPVWLSMRAGVATYLVTIDGEEDVYSRWVLTLGLVHRDF